MINSFVGINSQNITPTVLKGELMLSENYDNEAVAHCTTQITQLVPALLVKTPAWW
jgi:hypothetical protein